MNLKQEKNKIIIKIDNLNENEIKYNLEELVKKGLKEIVENNQVILDLQDIGLNENEFKNLIKIFSIFSIPIDLIKSTNPITKMIAVNYGIPIEAQSIINTQNKLQPRPIPIENKNIINKNKNSQINQTLTNQMNPSNQQKILNDNQYNNQDIVIYKKNIRSGSLLEDTRSIILIGNVNQGGEIRSSNNVIILGKLMGTVHAGYPNNPDSIIFCLKLKNPLIKIANMVAEFNENEIKNQLKIKEIENILFFTENNSIRIEIIGE